MKRLPIWGFVAAFLLQAGLLVYMVADRAVLLAEGKEIRLAVRPVDPRDLLRGDYVVLSYDISQLDAAKLGGADDFEAGSTVYVSLRSDGEVWQASAMNSERTDDGAGAVLRGTIDGKISPPGCSDPCKAYRVTYGLEQFFVPEGKGRDLEQLRNDQKLAVDIAIDPDGRGAIKRLLVDGQVRYDTRLF
ncbi:putative membrane-anchored protein [Rhodoligotrophos appendicifer]|uniref:GDYXXLXY domain-containing protein n=1 Tax=Rhodoligotrophos appendicifer TaxID=987056 RepID=UPI001186490F|nr:GDYXXLXY domain-containing protein [Rhodoligotrophos appendicifer]